MVGLMAQSIPSVPIPPPPGICHFVLEKLQMPHGGAGRSYKNPFKFWSKDQFTKREGPDTSKGSNKQ